MDEQNTNMEVASDMTEVERNEHEKIKRAVSESLLDAFLAAESVKRTKEEERGIKYLLEMLGKAIPVIVIALVSWVCITIVEVQKDIALTQKDIVAMRSEIAAVGENITVHSVNSELQRQRTSLLHHTAIVSPCTNCHTAAGIKLNSKKPIK